MRNLRRVVFFVTLLWVSMTVNRVEANDLGDILGELFRSIVEKPKPRPQPFVPQNFPPPDEKSVQQRRERLEAFYGAEAGFLRAVGKLSDEQFEVLQTKLVAELTRSQEEYLKIGGKPRNGFGDFAPVRFAMDGAAAYQYDDERRLHLLSDVLSEEQKEAIHKAHEQRNQALLQAQRDWILCKLDDDLFFTSDQLEKIVPEFDKKLGKLKRPQLYSMTNQTYYLPYQSPQIFFSGSSEHLNDAQNRRLQQLRNGNSSGPDSERYVTFMSRNGVNNWYETLDEAIEKQSDRLERIAELQIAFYKAEYDLDPDTIHHLELAARGTVLYCMHDWKESTNQNLRQWEERIREQQQFRNGNFGFSVSVPPANSISNHELWQSTLAGINLNADTEGQRREDRHFQSRLEYLCSLLDLELWLTAEQRSKLITLLEKRVPKKDFASYEYMYEVVLISIPLALISDKEIQSILTPEQFEAWECLKKQFQINGRNVTIQMQNMGQFGFTIPQ